MFARRKIEMLLLLFAFVCVAQTTFIDVAVFGRHGRDIAKRQRGGSTIDSDASTSTPEANSETPTPTPTSSHKTTSATHKSTSSSGGKTEPTPITPTPTPAAPTSTPSNSALEPTNSSAPESFVTPTPTEPNSVPSETPSSPTTLEPVTKTIVVTTTNTDGSLATYTTESVSTPTSSLTSSQSKGSSGMSTQTRNTVIGVVVGIGGAIILAGVGIMAWRIWGRKKAAEETDGLMSYNTSPYNAAEKSEAGTSPPVGRTPFQSTLESYHAPTQVNTASNF